MGTFEGFAGHLHGIFSVGVGQGSVEMTLVQATKGKPRDWDGLRKEPFALIFKCGHPVVLPQRTYLFERPGFGKMDIFIVPVGRERDGVIYQAVFN
ncbi:MAG: DUF6916 family protein [Pseudolabrys sp.]